MSKEFWRWFDSVRHQLAPRTAGFELMLKHLDGCGHDPIVIETGCARRNEIGGGDGGSTLIWQRYIQSRPKSWFRAIDISPGNARFAQGSAPGVEVICADSVLTLRELAEANYKLDLLYLDSFDCTSGNEQASAEHHMRELDAAMPIIGPKTLVVVDDSPGMTGKGALVAKYAERVGARLVLDDYQIGWVGFNE